MKLNLRFISLLLIISLLAVSAAYANDYNETIQQMDDSNSAEVKTFTDLETIFNDSDSGSTRNYF